MASFFAANIFKHVFFKKKKNERNFNQICSTGYNWYVSTDFGYGLV